MRLPIAVKPNRKEEQAAETRDVSSGGVFFQMAAPVAVGSLVEFLLTLPEPITGGQPVRIRCLGKVVRVEGAEEEPGRLGVAATIERYEFVRES